MDLSKAKTELSNEYKMFEIQVTTSPHFGFMKYCTTLSITIFFTFFPASFMLISHTGSPKVISSRISLIIGTRAKDATNLR